MPRIRLRSESVSRISMTTSSIRTLAALVPCEEHEACYGRSVESDLSIRRLRGSNRPFGLSRDRGVESPHGTHGTRPVAAGRRGLLPGLAADRGAVLPREAVQRPGRS